VPLRFTSQRSFFKLVRSEQNIWLHRFSLVTALTTLVLVCIGGLVTSHEAGMSVPDWPTSYGYNMFLFPISKWVGGIFYEHTHRLVASAVGFLTIILMVWLWVKEERRWLRWLGTLALGAVILQGILGGLRVIEFKQELGIFHAILAQMFFVLVSAIALFTSRTWPRLAQLCAASGALQTVRRCVVCATLLIFFQLTLGASMRHQHAGLAVPDFPLAYGQLWPATDPVALQQINKRTADARDFVPITRAQIWMHMLHRIMAVFILIAVSLTAITAQKNAKRGAIPVLISKLAWLWFGLIFTQAALGVATVLTNKAADIATAHVLVGALSLVTGCLTWIVLNRLGVQAFTRVATALSHSEARLAAV
jgi:cytochrome c oxidase assembly protein subunit 15